MTLRRAAAPGWDTEGGAEIELDGRIGHHGNRVVNVLTPEEAREITNKIRQGLAVAVVQMKKAYNGRAWVSLGYESWVTYCRAEFGDALRLGRDDRQELVLDLADAGMSTRAIAAVTGVSKSTVADDLAGVQNRTPAAPRHAPDDPHCWCPTPCPGFRAPDDDNIADVETVDGVAPNNVIGLDGKTYTRPTPKPEPETPRRYPITKTAENLAYDLEKLTRRVERFRQDKRVRAQRDHVSLKRLNRVNDLLQDELHNLGAVICCSDDRWVEWCEKFGLMSADAEVSASLESGAS